MLDQTEPLLLDEAPIAEMVGPQAKYIVRLPAFEGPLDLLLYLIEKRQMEITTISLVAVTDQYLAYLQHWQEEREEEAGARPAMSIGTPAMGEGSRLANMAAFIAIAARLLFIKSQSLLPHTTKEELTGEMESAAAMAEELRTHLLEYKLAKELASYLRQREEAGLQTHGRSGLLAGIEAQLAWTPPTLVGLEPQALAKAFQRLLVLQAKDAVHSVDLMPLARVRVSDRIAAIVELLSEQPSILLEEALMAHECSRLVIVVTFLAVLDLWKHERICVKQDSIFGPILLERGERWEDAQQASGQEVEDYE